MDKTALVGRVALVTGGGSGLGLAIAASLAEAGASVVIAGRRADMLEEAVARVGVERCRAVAGDVTRAADRRRMVAYAVETFAAPVSILVNNAGIHLKKPAMETTDEEFESVMQTHVNAAFALAREVAAPMRRTGQGSILFIASMASLMGIPQIVAYTAAKSAILGITRALAAEWSPDIRVNAITPGWIDTPMLHRAMNADPERRRRVLARTPMQAFGMASDIGSAAVFLSSDAARFITGTALVVDGGASIGL